MQVKRFNLSLLLLCLTLLLQANAYAGEFNKKDEQGRRQGEWRGYFASGALRYEGQFVNNEPIGVFTYYYPQGGVRAELIHEKGEEAVKATYYHRNRRQSIMGEGFFVNQKMNGLWRFFNEQGVLLAEHFYHEGENHGVWKTYYDNGTLAEMQTWHRGEQQGPMERYFPDGTLYMRAHYENNLLNGAYEIYHVNGQLSLQGVYRDDLNENTWTYYTPNGEIIRKVTYKDGMIVHEEVLLDLEEEAIPLRPGPSRHDTPWDMNGF